VFSAAGSITDQYQARLVAAFTTTHQMMVLQQNDVVIGSGPVTIPTINWTPPTHFSTFLWQASDLPPSLPDTLPSLATYSSCDLIFHVQIGTADREGGEYRIGNETRNWVRITQVRMQR
jgi:hypothetical protein